MNIVDLAILKKMIGGGGGSGTDNYNDLSNLPQINGETLAGNKTAENLGLQDALTFDSAPTEDSTNPVESGGIYTALTGKQDNLTFDDDPTENSTNPVKSGGVYSALAGKQDNLTFDGVYNASTNKAATESTVTNAIAGLDVSAFSVDADETISSISETDGKINVTKQDIAIASNQVTAMTGYTKPSSAPATPAIQTSDTANQAFGKLEFKADTNQTNILYALGKTGRNHFNLDMSVVKNWNTGGTWNGNVYTQGGLTFTFNSDGTIDVSGTATERVNVVLDVYYPLNTEIGYRFNELDGLVLSGCPTGGAWNRYSLSLQMTDSPWTSAAIDTGSGATIDKSALPSNTAFVAFYLTIYASYPTSSFTFKPMFCTQEDWSITHDYTSYQGVPNYDLTRLEAQDRASLVECVDGGAKNIAEIPTTQTIGSITFTKDSNEWITSTATNDTRAWNTANRNVSYSVKAGTYIVYAEAPSTNTGDAKAYVFRNDTPEIALDVSPGQSKYIEITFTTASNIGIEYKTNQNKVRYMICTKAAFGVSNKFVPYRPNWDLVSYLAGAGGFKDNAHGGGIANTDLNAISTTSFTSYNNPTNMPTGLGGWCYVRTYVHDNNGALQELFMIQANPVSYFRIKSNGTWSAWIQTSNVS